VDFAAISTGFQNHAAATLLTLSLLALAWIYKDQRAREREHAEEVRELYKAHLETAMQVAPLASKLVTCVEVLERLSFRAREG
jgi:hypothetical protein